MKQDADVNTQAMQAIRTGLGVSETFWDNFLAVTNNTDGLAELLGVRPDQVAGWGARIRQNLDKVQNTDAVNDEQPMTKVLDTGEKI